VNGRYRRGQPFRHFSDVLVVVVGLSLLPYLDRDVARTLGRWVLITPALAVWVALYGVWNVLESGKPFRGRAPGAELALALGVLTAALLNGVAVWHVWIAGQPKPKSAVKTTDLNELADLPGVKSFASEAGKRPFPSAPGLKVLTPDLVAMLAQVECKAIDDPGGRPFAGGFVCTRRADRSLGLPGCRFTWPLSPVYDPSTSALATVKSRDDVVTKFTTSGYGKWGVSSGNSRTAPYVGVAFVTCAKGGIRKRKDNLRVAFVLDTASQIRDFRALFRAVGFDWISADYFAKPYVAELFALTSLFEASRIIYTDRGRFARTLTTSANDDLFDASGIEALRALRERDIRVGNRSDGQLGNSRGSCLLVAKAVEGRTAPLPVHVAPSAATTDLTTSDRSLVLLQPKRDPISLPCTLASALVTRNMSAAAKYPNELTGTQLRYSVEPGEPKLDAQRPSYNVRAAGLTLYLLGFAVSYDAEKSPRQVIGA
jgi:hypothetical protein